MKMNKHKIPMQDKEKKKNSEERLRDMRIDI